MNKEKVVTSKPKVGPMGGGPMMRGPAEKPKDFKRAMKQLARSLKEYWLKIIIVFVFAIASTVFAIVSPKILGQATNQIVDDYVNMKAYDSLIKTLPTNTSHGAKNF